MGFFQRSRRKFQLWLFEGKKRSGSAHDSSDLHKQHPWWQVMCLTGVDYFSTLGYQPGIAFLAAGALSPIATLVLVLLTLFGALPIYNRVAAESPHGEGSISMLEHLLSRWKGKLFVLVLLGFVATDFIITITLSAADATAHIIENPFTPSLLRHPIGVTLILIVFLAGIFLKGFKEAIGVAVFLVAVYLMLNVIVIGLGLYELFTHPIHFLQWRDAVFLHPRIQGSFWMVILVSLIIFPKLALGLSGFETGVAVMPLVKGDRDLTKHQWEEIHSSRTGHRRPAAEPLLAGRIRNTRKLLRSAALIMSVMLITSSFVTATLIPPEKFEEGGEANGRALSYLAHHSLGDIFGTAYDLSTILILWFAGASAMAGLLNIVPRYLPRYGMAPEWTVATRPLVIIFTAICFLVTILFKADVEAQAGAYATGVLALMTSATVAVTLSARRAGQTGPALWFGVITLIFVYTTLVNIVQEPSGLRIALLFIGGIVFTSLFSRAWRSTELRIDRIEFDAAASRMIDEEALGDIQIIANKCQSGDLEEYELKAREQSEANGLASNA